MPRGLDERIYHVAIQRQRGRPHRPGYPRRAQGYRAWTHKQNFPATRGRWQVRVLTEDGQVIGVLRFKVTDAQTDNPK
jgi:antibiotic biosynthesis monooxygenase (ABM) superfamily enzyme